MGYIADYPCTFWIILGVVLSILEIMVPGVVLIFFGAGAIATGLLALCIPPLSASWTAMLLLFSILSSVSLTLFRRRLVGRYEKAGATSSGDIDELCAGHYAVTITEVGKNGGTVEFNGVNWKAFSDTPIQPGTRVFIRKRDGLSLFIEEQK